MAADEVIEALIRATLEGGVFLRTYTRTKTKLQANSDKMHVISYLGSLLYINNTAAI